MIARLQGRLLEVAPDHLVLGVGGVGYSVHIPLSTYYEVNKLAPEAEATLHVHTHVRDDALQLYGFWSRGERAIFERLIAVSGIGPRLAQTILSGMPADELVQALAASDVRRLVAIPGVGKKTAERMVLELKDKVRELAVEPVAQALGAPVEGELTDALVNLGYRRGQAEKAVAKVLTDHADAPFADQLKACLRQLSPV